MGRIGGVALACLALIPTAGAGQDARVGLQFAVGSPGGGILLAGTPQPWMVLRGGIHAMPRTFRTRFGGLEYVTRFPSPTLQAGVDLFPFEGTFRLSGGVFLLRNQVVLDTGTLGVASEEAMVQVGENLYQARRVGRIEGRAEGRSSVPWLAFGWGGSPTPGPVGFFLDLGVALWGEPRLTVAGSGAERGNPAFQADLERERETMDRHFARFARYPLVVMGVTLPLQVGRGVSQGGGAAPRLP